MSIRRPTVLLAALLTTLAPAFEAQAQYDSRFYQPVAPQPRSSGPPCGHVGTPPCPVASAPVVISPTASADDLWTEGSVRYARRDFAGAMPYLQRAAELGHVRAQYAFGYALLNGNGIGQDIPKGLEYIDLAADKGHKVAQSELGDLYYDGDFVKRDPERAIAWYRKSAEQHWWKSDFRIGLAYELGYGVPRDRATSIQWLNRAAADGHVGLPQQIAALLSRSSTPRFNTEEELFAALGQAVTQAYYASFPKPVAGISGPGAQYTINRSGAPGNTCGGPYGAGQAGCH